MAQQPVDALAHLAGGLVGEVTARMESGATPFSRMSQAMRLVMTRVLPEPARRESAGAFGGLDGGALFGIQIVGERLQGQVRRKDPGLVYGWGRESGVLAQQCQTSAPAFPVTRLLTRE